MVRFATVDDVVARAGEDIGATAWTTVDQARIDGFADLSGDHQWIHVDPQRAAAEGPYGGTVAHGALTLSLCVTFVAELLQIEGASRRVNAGFDRVRFFAPVPAGASLRGRATLVEAKHLRGCTHALVEIRADVCGPDQAPEDAAVACVATQAVVLYC